MEVIERYTTYVTTITREILNVKATAEDVGQLPNVSVIYITAV